MLELSPWVVGWLKTGVSIAKCCLMCSVTAARLSHCRQCIKRTMLPFLNFVFSDLDFKHLFLFFVLPLSTVFCFAFHVSFIPGNQADATLLR